MKMSAMWVLLVLVCLSGCDNAEEGVNSPAAQESARAAKAVEPKLSARSEPAANPQYDAQDAAEDLDATGKPAQAVPDRDAETYDTDAGSVPNPEAGDPVDSE